LPASLVERQIVDHSSFFVHRSFSISLQFATTDNGRGRRIDIATAIDAAATLEKKEK